MQLYIVMAMHQNNKQTKKYYELGMYIKEATNAVEEPLDYKLTQEIILESHRGEHFWNTLEQQQQQQHFGVNRICAWKFCCLLHRLLRDGHYEFMKIAQQKCVELESLRDYWMRESMYSGRYVGVPNSRYFQFLLLKLNFHKIYSFINGDMHMNRPKEWNLNVCFQLALDILNYLESILDLLADIFYDIEVQNCAITSIQAQCRLTNVRTLVYESNSLYLNFITIQNVLTNSLPANDIVGIQNRFHEIFERLTQWFAYLRSLGWALQMDHMPELPATVTATAPSTSMENFEILRRDPMQTPTAPMEYEFY